MAEVVGDIFLQLGIVILIAGGASLVLRLFRQPQILAYVLTGILITPVFGLITETSIIESMSIIGIAFLLFLVGMEMDLRSLKSVTLVSTVGGTILVAIMFVLGYLLALLLGYLSLQAAYVGLAIAFSSTMLVMKLLSDKRELQTLHGRIIVGILLVEDLIAIFALSLLSSINEFSFSLFTLVLLKFVSLFAIAFLLSTYFFPGIFRFAAKHQELLLVVSLAVCFFFALGFQYLGYSIAIGAFIAGIALGNLDYRLEIIAKVKSLKDFFALLFFVSLGMGLSLTALGKVWMPLAILLAIVLFLKPAIITVICSLFKYTKKPAFLTAISLAQAGEFSIIIASQGLFLGHIPQELFSLVVLLALITFTLTPYFKKYDQAFYRLLQKPLSLLDVFHTEGMEYTVPGAKTRIVLCGYNRIGYSILQDLRVPKNEVLVVDFNPEIIDSLAKQNYHCLYGDVTDDEIIERMQLNKIELLISTVPEMKDNLLLIRKVTAANRRAKVMVTASDIDDALRLYDAGADYVILPHFLGGEHVSKLVNQVSRNAVQLHEEKKKHLAHLHERKRLGHNHPMHH